MTDKERDTVKEMIMELLPKMTDEELKKILVFMLTGE